MTGIITEKHTCIDYETGAKVFVVVARSENSSEYANGRGEDWIVVSERIWRRAFIEGWRVPFQDCQIEYGPNVTIKLKTVPRFLSTEYEVDSE
jgi:hypothetical protein